jgi:adenylate cyclase class 2
MLKALGFTSVAIVRKQRRTCHIAWEQADVEICVDQVDRLGPFVELELVAEADDLDAARDRILSLARRLGLSGAERRSYLELLLCSEAES